MPGRVLRAARPGRRAVGVPGVLSFAALLCCAAADDRSLARLAPADAGLFVELYRAEDLLIPLTEPHVWLTLADLAGQPAKEEDAREWRRRIEHTIRMDPADAIRTLFARRAAFIGAGPGRSQDAVVLCQPAPSVQVEKLVEGWSPTARRRENELDVYTLRNNVGLAVYDGSLIFGDAGPSGRMFRHVLDGLAHGARAESLANERVFSALLRRVPSDPDGILFARLSQAGPLLAPASAPASQATAADAFRTALPELPGPFRGAGNVLMALHREKDLLHFSAVSDAGGRQPRGDASGRLTQLVRGLPERTLFVSAGHVDFARLVEAAKLLPARNLFRLVLNLESQSPASLKPLLEALDSATALSVGVVWPENRDPAAPPLPALALVIATREPEQALLRLGELIETLASVYNLLSIVPGVDAPLLPKVQPIEVDGRPAGLLDLGPLIPKFDKYRLTGELHVCWAVDETALVIASHRQWLEQILRARRGEGPTLARVFELPQKPVPAESETVFVFQTGPISDLARLWLEHCERALPHVLDEDYWRGRQPGGLVVRLGVSGVRDNSLKRLIVQRVDPDGPAAGFLREGDAIVGINARPFATTQPFQEFQQGMVERPNARWVDVVVQRGGAETVVRVPLPFVDPIEALRRAWAIGRIAQRIIYYDDVPDAAGPRGFLTVELRRGSEPLFAFGARPEVEPPPEPIGQGGDEGPR